MQIRQQGVSASCVPPVLCPGRRSLIIYEQCIPFENCTESPYGPSFAVKNAPWKTKLYPPFPPQINRPKLPLLCLLPTQQGTSLYLVSVATIKRPVLINILFSPTAEPTGQVEEAGTATEDGLHRHQQSLDESESGTAPRTAVSLAGVHRESPGQR